MCSNGGSDASVIGRTVGETGSAETGWKFFNGGWGFGFSLALGEEEDEVSYRQLTLDMTTGLRRHIALSLGASENGAVVALGATLAVGVAIVDEFAFSPLEAIDKARDGLLVDAAIIVVGAGFKPVKAGRKALGATIGVAPAKRASNQTVLGSYPEYVKLSDELGARRFEIPTDVWNRMSSAQRWGANKKFLDRMISKGDEVILSNPAMSAQRGTSFFREIEYLKSLGYRVSDDGLRMLPKN